MSRSASVLVLLLAAAPATALAYHGEVCGDPYERLCDRLCERVCDDGDDCDEEECQEDCEEHFENNVCSGLTDLLHECESFCEDHAEENDCDADHCQDECHDILYGERTGACYRSFPVVPVSPPLLPRYEAQPPFQTVCPVYPQPGWNQSGQCTRYW
jgi:hypothetical protein